MNNAFTVPLGNSKYAMQYYNGKFVEGKMVFDVRIVRVSI